MKTEVVYKATLRTITSILVALAFLLLLVVASAQQQALLALQGAKLDVSYSVARKVMREARNYQAELDRAQDDLKASDKTAAQLQGEFDEAKAQYEREVSNARELATSIQRSDKCDRFPRNQPISTNDDMSLWQGINSCFSEGNVPAQVATDIKAMQTPERDPSAIRARIERLASQQANNTKQSDIAGKNVEYLNDKIIKAKSVVDAMEDISVLDSAWIVSIFGLTSVPPSLMQIFLSFSGGLFGALLLTLILAVYPNNGLEFTAGEGYWNRILLGGLISVSVFVVLGGGVAVLGSKDALSTGESNFLAFCAIGILAGMFSDRVAKWLSDKAKIFVSEDQQRGGNGDGNAPDPLPGTTPQERVQGG